MNTLFQKLMDPYSRNENTGNVYEITVALGLLRNMGLSNDILDSNAELCEKIAVTNKKKTDIIRKLFTNIRSIPLGTELLFDRKKIVDILNVTQDDGEGRTGDLILIDNIGNHYSVSITGGKAKRNGVIEKCLSNPSANRYGCTQEDIQQIKNIGLEAIEPYKAEMKAQLGEDESKWARKQSNVAKEACVRAAKLTASRFETLSPETKVNVFNDILRIECGKKPADYLALVDPDKLKVTYYEFGSCYIQSWNPRLVANGIYLEFYADETKRIGSTQVKFNNGVWHNGKTSSLYSSWNATFNLSDLFTMRAVSLG